MDNFKVIYLILAVLEKAMDGALDLKDISPENLGITEKRRNQLLLMMQEQGYICGVREIHAIGMHDIRLKHMRITLSGLEYLADNTMMKKAYRLLKGIKDATPGM